MLLWLPIALGSVCGLLAIATILEEQRARVAVRLTMRSTRATPEETEALVAAELQPVLLARGFGRDGQAA